MARKLEGHGAPRLASVSVKALCGPPQKERLTGMITECPLTNLFSY